MATPAPESTPGGMATFNILHGFPEALVRGMRSSFLADSDYHHLTQCETLDDFRLNLSETDYSAGVQDKSALTPTSLQSAAVEKVCRVVLEYSGVETDEKRRRLHDTPMVIDR
jgi:V-type H+-transporting ATPase subunit d